MLEQVAGVVQSGHDDLNLAASSSHLLAPEQSTIINHSLQQLCLPVAADSSWDL